MPEIEFVTFNTHHSLTPKREGFVPNDLGPACLEFKADVLVLQEHWRPDEGVALLDQIQSDELHVTEHAIARVKRRAGRKPIVSREGLGTWGLGLASRFPIRSERILPLGRVWRDPAGPRHALWVELDVEGGPLDVVVIHTSSKVPYGPITHLRNLRPQLPEPSRPAVVAGDCNLWGPWVSAVLPGWRRAGRGRPGPAHRPPSQIDHILVNERITVVNGEVLEDHGSDHRPIRARLRLD